MAAVGCGGGHEPRRGRVVVTTAVVDELVCPDIQTMIAAPAQASVGSQIALTATVTPARADNTLVYAWSPETNIKPASSASAAYTCSKPGRQTLKLTITEKDPAGSCTVEESLSVLCVAAP